MYLEVLAIKYNKVSDIVLRHILLGFIVILLYTFPTFFPAVYKCFMNTYNVVPKNIQYKVLWVLENRLVRI
jgi:hypothetical protein